MKGRELDGGMSGEDVERREDLERVEMTEVGIREE